MLLEDIGLLEYLVLFVVLGLVEALGPTQGFFTCSFAI